MSGDETKLPQVSSDLTAATLPVESRVSGATGSTDSGGSHSLGTSHGNNKENNARGGDPVSKTSTVSNQTKRIPKVSQQGIMPFIRLNGLPLSRSASQSSLQSVDSTGSTESLVSAASTSSNMTDIDGAISKRKWEEIAKLRKRMH